jgi:nitroreductase
MPQQIIAHVVPAAPAENEPAAAARESIETLTLMAQRRSSKVAHLREPGPSADEVDTLLRLAARAPDHGKLGPWRFLVLEGEGRMRAGHALAGVLAARADSPERVAFERQRFLAAPVSIIVVSTAAPHAKIPEWEQVLSAGAVCYGLLIAAHAMGFAGCWLTDWFAYDADARTALGLAAHELIAGALYFGTAGEPAIERVRPDMASRVKRL